MTKIQENEDRRATSPLIAGVVGETRVCISSSMDLKSRVRGLWRRLHLKAFCQHIGLLVALASYTLLGGLVFRKLEYSAEILKINFYKDLLIKKRQNLIETIVNNTDVTNLDYLIEHELDVYDKALEASFKNGIFLNPNAEMAKWTTLKSVFFCSTVLTTIGYGNIVPMTTEGKSFCIVFALVGIPLTLTVIADWGRLFASTLSAVIKKIPPLPKSLRNAMVARRTSSYALTAVCFLFCYLAIGAAIFVLWEEDWSFFDGFYFCFITMTTIGFGDLVPKQPKYMLFCTLYILVGLALTSTIIELVRRQYAQSWRQLQALRGPLAENLRKLAENAPGLDVLSFQQDLMKVLTVVSMPKRIGSRRDKKSKEKAEREWEEALQAVIQDMTTKAANKESPVLQIVIYESSV
ncbi:LOW QUALITY PROTEIN: TWiK family of potassium channels protein 7-like [Anthonomus grandis grandis]|uniref:LOW QUALITY PROTEIN: TWiK family of potassium channels protein 7-like n=1 Tax=Anthonomus grandis grandis TaxID=2921223 RepID=UPI0021653ED0|nr:LOW QUALITY PROTEIN: TWiK family of potassium channels protein 7-like [Anthonomus grandis grandis]